MNKKIVRSRLIGKNEIFKLLSVAESVKLPILFQGLPGTAKTQALMDYAGAFFNYDKDLTRKNTFVIELDEGTKSGDVKGRVNMKEFMENKHYTLHSPIADASFVLINEVDKGSSAIRNSLLSIMRERALFLGDEVKHCKWQVFAASCNTIPEDEKDSPFWDRFVLKFRVDRINASEISKMWEGTQKDIEVIAPSKEDIEACELNINRMKVFVKIIYSLVSDRTLSYIPNITRAIKLVYECSEAEAIMKCCDFICPSMTSQLAKELEDQVIVKLKSNIKSLSNIDVPELLSATSKEISADIDSLTSKGYDENTITEMKTLFNNESIKAAKRFSKKLKANNNADQIGAYEVLESNEQLPI